MLIWLLWYIYINGRIPGIIHVAFINPKVYADPKFGKSRKTRIAIPMDWRDSTANIWNEMIYAFKTTADHD